MYLLLYLHGFNSSPDSRKAQLSADWFARHAPHIEFVCPQLPPYGFAAIERLNTLVEGRDSRNVFLIGSSMGGFFATFLIEKYGFRGVLINPAVRPAAGLDRFLGNHRNYHSGEEWVFTQAHIDEYRHLECAAIEKKSNVLVLLQTDDEVLDYRLAVQHYRGCDMVVESGGGHAFSTYAGHLGTILEFLMGEDTPSQSGFL